MASPATLQVIFCNKLPGGVDSLIFEMGFHIWFAKPHETYIYDEFAETTIPFVPRDAVSEQTWNSMYVDQVAEKYQFWLQRNQYWLQRGKNYIRVSDIRVTGYEFYAKDFALMPWTPDPYDQDRSNGTLGLAQPRVFEVEMQYQFMAVRGWYNEPIKSRACPKWGERVWVLREACD
jgi:hypothetical protein